jgi:hypothetical protein
VKFWRSVVRTIVFVSTATATVLVVPEPSLAASPLGSEGLTPPQILARYSAALAKVKTPKAISFDYVVEQLGLHDMEQTHHVYRSALDERDETLVVDGYTLKAPEVRIIANRGYRYELHAIAPTAARYAFAYSGVTLDGDNVTYVFRTTPIFPGGFGVSEIEIDGTTFLPKVLRFKVANATANGSGQLSYARADVYWVIVAAQVNAHLANGSIAHENIRWSNYQFPPSLPPSTFKPPHAALTPAEPDIAPTATPTPTPDAGAP